MSLKNPVIPPGIDPGTVGLIVQRLNHYATPGPDVLVSCLKNNIEVYIKILMYILILFLRQLTSASVGE
jgi:hypothetical protein